MAIAPTANGWVYDESAGTYGWYRDGVEIVRLTSSGASLASGKSFDLSAGTVTLPTRTAFIDLEPFVVGADGAALAATETAGDFFRPVGTNQMWIQGEASQNETEASVGYVTLVLPENYVSGGTITLSAYVDVIGSGTLGTCTIDFEAYKMTLTDGTVGSDLVTTAATAVSATGAEKTFTVTPTGLVAGDKLVIKMTTSIAETGNSTTIAAVITRLGATVQVNK